jgi:diguanylate cyclase (GGDEF)-like protein
VGADSIFHLRSEGHYKQGLFIVALGLFFLAIVAAGIMSTAGGANDVELERSTRLAQYAVGAKKNMLAASAEANSYWDDAAQAVYSGGDRDTFFDTNWLPPTADNADYDAVFAFDPDDQLWHAGEHGNHKDGQLEPELARSVQALLGQLRPDKDNVSGLINDNGQMVLLSASQIRFTEVALNEKHIGNRYHKLVYLHRLDTEAISKMGTELGVGGMVFGQRPTARPAIALQGTDGQTVGYLSWAPPSSGATAVRKSMPILVAGSILFFVVLGLTARFGFSLLMSLSEQAKTDALSGLPNRRALRKIIAESRQHGRKHALALIDLDGFKNVNDRFGHAVGDQLIRLVAHALSKLATEDGMVARLGGDEFAVMVSGWDAAKRIETLASRFIEDLEHPLDVDGRSIWVGASIGLAVSGSPVEDDGEILRRADIAMYSAKQKGKMRAEWFEVELDEQQQNDAFLSAELRAALQSGDLGIVYQPIVDSKTKICQSVEALVRWTSPTFGVVAPDRFIPIAETHGMIDAIGLFVLKQACVDISACENVGLAVNVSAAQLRNPAFPAQLQAILAETAFDPARLELEITETYLISNTALAQRVIGDILDLGVSVSLDDFGTGYASIGFLRQFAFGKLKIDKSLVQQGMHDEAARSLVHLSIAAARAMKMLVTAEGVETQAQADLMQVAGCDQLQGWHCGYPMTFTDLSDLLTGGSAIPTSLPLRLGHPGMANG